MIDDFSFCRDEAGPFILYKSSGSGFHLDYETEEVTETSIPLHDSLTASPDCTRIFSARIDQHNNDILFINEWNGETEELVEEFSLSSDQSGIQGFHSLHADGGVVDLEFNPVNGHLFLLAAAFAPFDGEPAIVEFDWETKEIVNAMALPEPASANEVRGNPGPAFALRPETEEFFLELPATEDHRRRVGRFSAEGVLEEILLPPDLPPEFFTTSGNSEGFVLDPATGHPIVYANSFSPPGGAGFFELAPAAPAAGKGWERYE